jgi:3-oxoadipate enol-lactonase
VIRTDDGVELNYSEQGSGDAPLLLLHGFTGSSLDWIDVIGDLAGDRRVVTYDQRGHGDSTNTGDPGSYTFKRLTADLHHVVVDRGLGPVDLLGHSMGGIVSMQFALAHPGMLRSLVLMDTAGAPAGGIASAFIDMVMNTARENGMSAVADMFVRFLEQQPRRPRDEVVARVRRKLSSMDVEAFAAFANELNNYESLLDGLAGLDLPVTVIVGEHDAGLRPGADALAATIPGAELTVIPDAGHSPQEDQPGAWLAAVKAHLARVD